MELINCDNFSYDISIASRKNSSHLSNNFIRDMFLNCLISCELISCESITFLKLACAIR